MKTGSRVVVTFAESANLEPSPGTVVDWQFQSDKGMIIKVRHDNGQDNWHLAKEASPLLKSVK
jgi:hypothetical protein